MSRFEWESVGAALLEREPRPVVLLDREGVVVRVNRALLFFLEPGTRTTRARFVDAWVSPQSRDTFAQAWRRALAGKRGRVAIGLEPAAFQLSPIFELVPLRTDGVVRSVLLVLVELVAPEPAGPLLPAVGTHYEVAVGDDGRPGRVLRALSTDRPIVVDETRPCWAVIRGQSQCCERCPVTSSAADTPLLRLESASPFRAQALWSRRVRPDVAAVSMLPLDETFYSALVQLRVEALAQRAQLSARERHVLELLLMGRSLDDIALVEGITRRTTKYHQHNLLRKLGAESRHDLFRLLG